MPPKLILPSYALWIVDRDPKLTLILLSVVYSIPPYILLCFRPDLSPLAQTIPL